MGKRRRRFEREVLDRLKSIEDDLALLKPTLLPTVQVYSGYTCGGCGMWVSMGELHGCNIPLGPNTCQLDSGVSEKPNLKVV